MHDLFVTLTSIYEQHRRAVLLAGAALLLIIGSTALKSCYDKGVVEDYTQKEELKQEKASRKADAKAAEQRTKDALENEKWEREYGEAIESAEDSPLSDATLRLNCERLRRAAFAVDTIPACRGY